MAKRGLCILLAILTLFALAVPAFAAEEGEVDASGSIGDDLEWSLSGGTVTVSGTGEMFQYYEPEEWEDNQDLFENVIIESGVTGLRPNAFSYCGNLKSVSFPDTLTSISMMAFQMCSGLTAVDIPGSVDTIGSGAFAECEKLKDVTIGKGVRIIQGSAFTRCAMTNVTIPDSVTLLDDSAFSYCKSLQSVTIPKSVGIIGADAFRGCSSLKDVTVLNPSCTIYEGYLQGEDNTLGVPGTTVVHGYAGSTAETYAKTYGYTFKEVDEKPAKLTAPTVKISQTDSGIKVTWNKVEGSARYMVYYKQNGGGWKKIGTTDKTSYTRKASALKAGATYQFAVRCCDSDKKTMLSGYKASNKVKYVPELTAPTVKISQTDSGIKVTWNKVSGSDRYMVYYKQNGGSWKKIGTTTATSYTRKASALKAGATYQFAVRCCASDKKTMLSGYKASNKVKYVPELTAPTVKISQTDSGIKVTWNKVSGAAKYMVYYKQNGGSWQKIGTTTKTSYTRKASALKAGATYQFAVRCCASDGKTMLSGYKASNKVKYTVAEQTTPSAPSVVAPTARPQTDGTYVLNTNSMKFHYPTCASAAKISAANRQDVTMSREEIIAQGYEPCKVCKP